MCALDLHCLCGVCDWQRQCVKCSRMPQRGGAGALAWWLGQRKRALRGPRPPLSCPLPSGSVGACSPTHHRSELLAGSRPCVAPGHGWRSVASAGVSLPGLRSRPVAGLQPESLTAAASSARGRVCSEKNVRYCPVLAGPSPESRAPE